MPLLCGGRGERLIRVGRSAGKHLEICLDGKVRRDHSKVGMPRENDLDMVQLAGRVSF